MPGMLAAQFTALSLSQSPSPQSSLRLAIRPSLAARARSVAPRTAASAAAVSAKPAAASSPLVEDRTVVRIGLPSKGRMAEQTLSLLKVRRSFPMGASVAGFGSFNCMFGTLIWLWLCFCAWRCRVASCRWGSSTRGSILQISRWWCFKSYILSSLWF